MVVIRKHHTLSFGHPVLSVLHLSRRRTETAWKIINERLVSVPVIRFTFFLDHLPFNIFFCAKFKANMPDKKRIDTLIFPLCKMLELAYLKEIKDPQAASLQKKQKTINRLPG